MMQSIVLVPIYDTHGPEACIHIINQGISAHLHLNFNNNNDNDITLTISVTVTVTIATTTPTYTYIHTHTYFIVNSQKWVFQLQVNKNLIINTSTI